MSLLLFYLSPAELLRLFCALQALKEFAERSATSNKVWVGGVDVGELNVDEVVDHRLCRLPAFYEQMIGDFNEAVAQLLEADEVLALEVGDDLLQLVEHVSHT